MALVENRNSLDSVKDAERAWHDAHYDAHAAYAYPESVDDFLWVFVKGQISRFSDGGWSWWGDARREAIEALGDVRGLRVLDYGCGYGGLGLYLAYRGARVWGFDLSPSAIETANRAAQQYRLPAEFAQMDAAALTYPDECFDLVVGFGVLHHVIKYPNADLHLHRILKPNGRAVFHETLWDNPLLNFARRFTSEHSDAGDAQLTQRAIRGFCRKFGTVRLEKRHLFYMLKRLGKLPVAGWNSELQPRPLWRFVKAVDDGILSVRPLRYFCGEVVIFLQK
jgi:2-polyprenyl-3-methyl-5-hydroxy-6-metoxy-1,4-benzoquinol methylase